MLSSTDVSKCLFSPSFKSKCTLKSIIIIIKNNKQKYLQSMIKRTRLYGFSSSAAGGGRVVRWCWVHFQCRGVLLIWLKVGQGPTALAVGGRGIFWTFLHSSIFSPLSPSLWETVRYRLKYCLKGPLNQKQTINQSTNRLPHG